MSELINFYQLRFHKTMQDNAVVFSMASSAYKIKLNLSLNMIISLINILNKRGPTFEPCDTLVLGDTIEEFLSPICTYCLQ